MASNLSLLNFISMYIQFFFLWLIRLSIKCPQILTIVRRSCVFAKQRRPMANVRAKCCHKFFFVSLGNTCSLWIWVLCEIDLKSWMDNTNGMGKNEYRFSSLSIKSFCRNWMFLIMISSRLPLHLNYYLVNNIIYSIDEVVAFGTGFRLKSWPISKKSFPSSTIIFFIVYTLSSGGPQPTLCGLHTSIDIIHSETIPNYKDSCFQNTITKSLHTTIPHSIDRTIHEK